MPRTQDCCDETDILKHNLQLGAYPQGFVDSVTNRSKGNIHLKKEVKPLGFTSRLYMRGVSEKFKHVTNRYNMRTVSKQNLLLEMLL